MKNLFGVFWLFAAVFCLWSENSSAEMKIHVTQGRHDPVPVAIPRIEAKDARSQEIARNLQQVLSADLQNCGLFRVLDPASLQVQDRASLETQPNFASWRTTNAQILFVGNLSMEGDNVVVEYRLWSVFNQTQLDAARLSIPLKFWRRLAHRLGDVIYEKVIGDEGYFDSRIVYVSESGPLKHRLKRLAIMDQDGANHRFLTNGKDLVLTPKFSPADPHVIAFISYKDGPPGVFIANTETGQVRKLPVKLPGMTFAPRFSPDGKQLFLSYAHGGKTILMSFHLETGTLKKITVPVSIDTSPTFSPDGSQVLFVSDRGGSPHLYIMNIDGSNQKRISFGKGSYTTPSWSPRGDWVCFVRKYKGEFFLGVMRPDGSGEREVARAFFMDTPSWSPNGRVIIYMEQEASRRDGTGGKTFIKVVDLTGFYWRQLPTPSDASDPSWSVANKN